MSLKTSLIVLVTGGAGFIGSHVVDQLLIEGHTVIVFDNLDRQVHKTGDWPEYLQRYITPSAAAEDEAVTSVEIQASPMDAILPKGPDGKPWPLHLHMGDIREEHQIRLALETHDPDVVIHLAAKVGVGQAEYQIQPYVETNTLGTAILLQEIHRRCIKGEKAPRILVAGSMSSYGEGLYEEPAIGMHARPGLRDPGDLEAGRWEHWDHWGSSLTPAGITEVDELQPGGFYALTKAHQEQLVLAFQPCETTVVRLFNVYGPRQALGNPYTGVAAIFANRIKAGEHPLVYEDGEQSRDFIYVTDVASAICLLALGREEDLSWGTGVFNVCTGVATTINTLAKTIAVGLDRPELTPVYPGASRGADVRHCFGDSSKLQALGWSPLFDLPMGLVLLSDWAREQEAREGLQEQAWANLLNNGGTIASGFYDVDASEETAASTGADE